jgi:hypothetical protein
MIGRISAYAAWACRFRLGERIAGIRAPFTCDDLHMLAAGQWTRVHAGTHALVLVVFGVLLVLLWARALYVAGQRRAREHARRAHQKKTDYP